MFKKAKLNIPNTISFALVELEIVFMLKHEGHYKVNYDRGTNCKETQVNKIHSYARTFDTQFVT